MNTESATCPSCNAELPLSEEVVKEWVCPCGHWKVLPVADGVVLIARLNLQHLGYHHRVTGLGSLLYMGFEMWAIKQALAEDPTLVRTLFSPN